MFLAEKQIFHMDLVSLKQIREIKKPKFIVLINSKICQEELSINLVISL